MNFKKIQAVFIDRDGTIGGTGNFIHPKEFQLYPFRYGIHINLYQ